MKKSDIRKIIKEEIQNSLKEIRRPNDIRFAVDAGIQVWVEFADLEDDNEIKKIKLMQVPLEEKIKLAKDRASAVAEKKVDEFNRGEVRFIYSIGPNDINIDRLDWQSLVTEIPEDEY